MKATMMDIARNSPEISLKYQPYLITPKIMKAYHDCGYEGYIRPDHGRHIWGEKCRPGYGLYDRALGIMYLLGIWDTLDRYDRP